jgi:dienelactone hydrolase
MRKYTTKTICLVISSLFLFNTITYAAQTENASTQKDDMQVPVRYVCESKGADVTWNSEKRFAIIQYENKTLQVRINSNEIVSNGETKIINNNVTAINGRILLPISLLNDELNLNLTNSECIKIIGVKFIDLLKSNNIHECSGLLSRTFSRYLKPDNIIQLAEFISALQLDLNNVSFSQNAVHQNISIPFSIREMKYNYTIRFDYNGKIDELASEVVLPESNYCVPLYGNKDKYIEEEVTIGNGIWKLPATLTVPKGDGPFPVVILVHDFGQYDRDESFGSLKPFKDLAVGLASNNIAVLRYNKRTFEHATKIGLIGNVTMNEETEQDVFAAAAYLKTNNKIDPSNILVAGHGLGGYALPKILNSDKAGIFKAGIVMNGYARPMYEALLEQVSYLAKNGLASQQKYDYYNEQINILKDPNFDPTNPPENYTLGSAYFYSYMKAYEVLKEANAINKPMLILQGEKDNKVSVQRDFEAWKSALNENGAAEFKLYPELNHMFTEGAADLNPSENFYNANIPEYVIDDILAFVNKTVKK